jgi:Family of unknown function (DUF6252)
MKTTSNFPVHSLAFLCLTVSLFTCKQTDVLPQATQEGKNTFGCLIDGKSYVPDGGGSFSGIKPVNGGFTVGYNANSLVMYIQVYSKDGKRIQIYVNNYVIGRYLLDSDTQTKPVSLNPKNYGRYISSSSEEYVTSSKYTGQITILKSDTTTGIISGNFDFRAVTSTGATVNITDGRFDVNNRTQ